MANNQARQFRKNPTLAERTLWRLVRRRQLDGHRFRRQHPIGPFIVDFVCLERKLIIELDGDAHGLPGALSRDIERHRWLAAEGYRLIRYRNERLYEDPAAICDEVRLELAGGQ